MASIKTSDYTYELPEDRIAHHPLPERDQSKLLIYKDGKIEHSVFSCLSDYLPDNSVLFFNNTKVIPARLFFQKNTGAVIEVFLLDPVWPSPVVALALNAQKKSRWHCTIGNLKRWPDNFELSIANNNLVLHAQLIDRNNSVVEFSWGTPISFSEVILQFGAVPLPPYIKRKAELNDQDRYQTVYSKEDGAVAAPTAGLHFTDNVFQSFTQKNIKIEYLTLHVSAGTFQPIKVENAGEHVMHTEQIVVTKKNMEQLLTQQKIICVGTTSLRTIESVYWYGVKLINNPSVDFIIDQNDAYRFKPVKIGAAVEAVLKKMDQNKTDQLLGETSIYIMPGYEFKITDALITNFHQPGSTLMLLVAAFVGNDWKKIYQTAIKNNYRFLSYGDSSLLFKHV
ncbi:MAG: S-adenosylmethionine:tRNA ribosyltransferase-isomerase [Bacteroidetes bacterium]|nr:S-adenosylmethionine:tRNA ribosyltransferase-isomerase [Bacteroidota bacterium]